jgi:ABC-2 type transport system ATP-binding protein
VTVQVTGALPPLPGVEAAREGASGAHRLSLADGTTPQDVLAALVAGGTIVERFEVATPALDEIFVQVVGRGGEAGAS